MNSRRCPVVGNRTLGTDGSRSHGTHRVWRRAFEALWDVSVAFGVDGVTIDAVNANPRPRTTESSRDEGMSCRSW
ncbi:hypothetical protein BRD12_01805 [Halobacteriales archaeon SW_12_67_38]|nr:MAG: hypothetical protein BRD12_01805 [Halobacteriales archaeon SW_12_67_38]